MLPGRGFTEGVGVEPRRELVLWGTEIAVYAFMHPHACGRRPKEHRRVETAGPEPELTGQPGPAGGTQAALRRSSTEEFGAVDLKAFVMVLSSVVECGPAKVLPSALLLLFVSTLPGGRQGSRRKGARTLIDSVLRSGQPGIRTCASGGTSVPLTVGRAPV
ncbi:hypothetical protein BGZ61DRAFT_557224 [Ilyonectria robusta]|uniref:uncharacterized protein n=1 Tax=Ilyonectria robusta TaxID=1079257 RepID=UPI001E8EDADE|nr:uncharacterized protein BGZ61DRAFT_557224 [Ilyonectria robusta]KAH8669897.1 hypothetical protein BGZ61DRAFT_557224 [Ilyonectria robusta]